MNSFRWMKWVESELRFYLCRDLYREDIEWKIKEMDMNIRISSSSLTGMPRGSSAERYSIVELQAEHREESRIKYQQMLETFNQRARKIGEALFSILPFYQEIIRLTYFNVKYSDSEIADCLGVDISDLQQLKDRAIHALFEKLAGAFEQFRTYKKAIS